MNSIVQDIKNRLKIEDLVSSYVKLERAGSNLKARCPFHNEKTPSFFVSPERGTYYCFGCTAKGDIFSFVEQFEGLDFRGTLKMLAERVGIRLEDYRFNQSVSKDEYSEKEKLYEAMEETTKFFENNLHNKNNNEALNYLINRGLKNDTIKTFRVGLANNAWRDLCIYLQNKGFPIEIIEKAGLIKRRDQEFSKDGDFYDRFRNRIIFPISDSSGRIIAFSGRIFQEKEGDQKTAKYLNSPETPIFHKSNVLYGLDKAKESIRKNDFSIVVEGQFDLILSHQAGYKNTVATSGTALANSDKLEDNVINHLGLVKRLSNNIIFVFDADNAGLSASLRAASIALSLEMNVKAAEIPSGLDPADLISKNGPEAWKNIIKNSKHIIEFLLDKLIIKDQKQDDLKIKLTVQDKIIPYLLYINNPIKRSHFVSMISHKYGIREEDIISILEDKEQDKKYQFLNNNNYKDISGYKDNIGLHSKKDHILRKLLGIILWQRNTKKIENLEEKIISYLEKIIKDDINKVLENIKNKEDLLFEVEVFYGSDNNFKNINKDVDELLLNLKEEYLRYELAIKMADLYKAEKENDHDRAAKIFNECKIINDDIQKIKMELIN